jgi:hypothetical protein
MDKKEMEYEIYRLRKRIHDLERASKPVNYTDYECHGYTQIGDDILPPGLGPCYHYNAGSGK